MGATPPAKREEWAWLPWLCDELRRQRRKLRTSILVALILLITVDAAASYVGGRLSGEDAEGVVRSAELSPREGRMLAERNLGCTARRLAAAQA
jgi:hypothetical protein